MPGQASADESHAGDEFLYVTAGQLRVVVEGGIDAPLEPGAGVRATRAAVRELSPRLRDDRSLSTDIEAVATAIRDGSLVAAAEAEVGELL